MTTEKFDLRDFDRRTFNTIVTIDNKQLSNNCSVDLEFNLSVTIKALQQQYHQFFYNPTSGSLWYCCETLSILANKPEVLPELAQNWPFLELLTCMLEGQNDRLVMAISELICHFSMDLQLDCGLLRSSRIFEKLIGNGKVAKQLNNEPVLVAVLKALEYWTLISVDNRKQILNIHGALELVTSSLTHGNRKWWEKLSIIQFIVVFFEGTAIHRAFFRFLCPSLVYKAWDFFFRSYKVDVPFGSPGNCSIIAEYLRTVLVLAIDHGYMDYKESPFILDNKAICKLAIKYIPVRFSAVDVLDDSSIKFLLIPRLVRNHNWQTRKREGSLVERFKGLLFYREYEIFSPHLPMTIVQHASRLLMSLSTDRFYGHESSMTHFREAKHLLDVEPPMSMPCREKHLIHQNACRTLVNVLDKDPQIRSGSEEWRNLLELHKNRNDNCIFRNWILKFYIKEKDDNEAIFKKLTVLRINSKNKKGLFGRFWCMMTLAVFGIMILGGLLAWLYQLILLLASMPFPSRVPLPVQSWIDSTGSGTPQDNLCWRTILYIQRTLLRLIFQYPVLLAVMLQLPLLFGAWGYMYYSIINYRNRVFWVARENYSHISSIRRQEIRVEAKLSVLAMAILYFAVFVLFSL